MFRGINRRRNGFTIIELLIVVIVIGILAAAGIGKYQSFAEKARSRTCMSNQTQIANAFSVYFTQYTGVPEDRSGSSILAPNSGRIAWQSGLYPWGWGAGNSHIVNIIRDTKGFFCPGSLAVYYGGNISNPSIPAETTNWWGPRRWAYMHSYSGPNIGFNWPAANYGTAYFPDAHDMVFCSEWGIPNDSGPDNSASSRHSARW